MGDLGAPSQLPARANRRAHGRVISWYPIGLAVVVAFAGLPAPARAGPLRDDAKRAARAFAQAVLVGDVERLCTHLVGRAYRQVGCGTSDADPGPLLILAIDCSTDIRVVSVSRRRARAEIPSPGVFGFRKDSRRPQQVELGRRNGRWKVTRLLLVPPNGTPVRRGRAFPPCPDAGRNRSRGG